MIRVQNLTKRFDQFTAVNQLSFDVSPGEVLGFLGPNGAGKSTTMKMITGFIQPTQGSISVCDINVLEQPQKAQQIMGYLPEGAPAYGEMTVIAFLRFIAKVRGLTGTLAQQRLDKVIQQVELEPVLNKTIETLSKGFARRVGLAQAIIHDPKVLILDEPTDGLDPNQKHHVRELIKGLAKDKIVIISTHILEEVSAVCSRALIISEGKLLLDGKPEELERKSLHHNAICLQLAQDYNDVQEQLSSIDQILNVEVVGDEDDRTYMLFPQNGEMLLPEVVRWLDNQQWAVENIHLEKGRLDDVFRQVTRAETV
ncbi:ABC transporter ATP-binding protein [Oceaniserpentilla sp. 4NH20-0058]|uniref:ABC transporter ATP-binding protein n=1 Tax=Oceaniserpentilla sp. 4NH20-0058 TaxID=3127660 RepID=UPI003103C034